MKRSPLNAPLDFCRHHLESLMVALIFALFVRHHFVEPFQIPTGSMATTLLGKHAMVKCPTCGWEFAVGRAQGAKEIKTVRQCPHCRQSVTVPPENYRYWAGEKILADKFTFRWGLDSPDRYEPIVFRPPGLKENFIKRMVSAGDEKIYLIQGDIWAGPLDSEEKTICPKPLSVQNEVWVKVYRMAHDVGVTQFFNEGEGWSRQLSSNGKTSAYLFKNYPEKAFLRWSRQSNSRIDDEMPYNKSSGNGEAGRKTVGDLKIAGKVQVTRVTHDSIWTCEIRDGDLQLECYISSESKMLCKGRDHELSFDLPSLKELVDAQTQSFHFEIQNWDDQIVVILNGDTVIPTTSLSELRTDLSMTGYHDRDGVAFGARNVELAMSDISLDRDIFYGPLSNSSSPKYIWRVKKDHFFAIGDNTNNSDDSRQKFGSIPFDRLLGRPWLRLIHWDFTKPLSPRDDWRLGLVR